jgi:hypothetical protein
MVGGKSIASKVEENSDLIVRPRDGPLWVDTVEKLRKECAAKIRPNAIMSKNRRSMPSQCSYGGLWLLAPQLPRPPKSLFDPQACGPPNFYWSPKT